MPDSEQPSGGLFRSVRRLLSSGLEAIQSRVELVKAELEREKAHWVSLLFRAVAVAVLVVSAANILVVAAAIYWREQAPTILLVAGVVYLLGGVGLFFSIKGKVKSHDSFGHLKEVLKRDKQAIDPDA